MLKLITAALAALTLVPAALAASDVAVPVGDPWGSTHPTVQTTAPTGSTVTFTATGGATSGATFTWRDPDAGISRYGGVILGTGRVLNYVVPAGSSRVTLDYCVKTSARFSRCILSYVYVSGS